jgi:zinc protease
MTPRSWTRWLIIPAAGALLLTRLLTAQPAPAVDHIRSLPLTAPVPVDPEITRGRLANGLHYYVRANPKPEKRAELRLVVKAGSILEEDDQRGLAHFVEHMAFNGTQHFPKNEVVSFLESLGMRFGADINAYTGFDETVFMLQVPTDKPGVLDRALLILEDWAHNVTFDPVEIDKERGVVVEEWRLRRGAAARLQDRLLPVLLKGSRYAERVPIGTMDIVRSFKPDRLKKFYADWYRPDLMAVVAVGDFDRAETEKLIKSHFGTIPARPAARPRPVYSVPDHPGTVYAVQTDKELTTTSVQVENLLPPQPDGAVGDYRRKIVDRIFASLISSRLAEQAQKPDAPFITAFAGRGAFLGRKDAAAMTALVKDGGVERGLEALLSEMARVSQFGFTATELDRQKQSMMRTWQRVLAEKNNRVSASRADEYVRNFLIGETLPTTDDEYALNARFVPEITLDEINRAPREWFPGANNRMVVVSAPDKPGVSVPTEAALAAVMSAGPSKGLTAYVDRGASSALLETPPAPGAIARTSTRDAIGITEWVLSNGVKVVLKPTTFKQDEILFRATSPGGTSLASDADFVPASSAATVVAAGGLGRFSPLELRKILTGKIASANPYITELDEGLAGGASPKDLETLFQLIYMRFTQPRADQGAVAVQAAQMKSLLANQSATPSFAFAQALVSALSQDHPRRRLATAATIDQWNLDKSLAFYKDRFGDASDFTFVFVGSFDVAAMKPLVERYLGALPSLHRKETWRDVGVRAPSRAIEKQVEKGIEPKSEAAIVLTGPFEYDAAHRLAVRAMAEVLQTRLREAIREELGGTYSIAATASYHRFPASEYAVSIGFGCDPARLDELIKRTWQEIETLKSNGPTEKQVADERAALQRDFETSSKQNGYLLGQLAAKYDFGEDPASIWSQPESFKTIDAAMIQDAARTYLKRDNRVQVTLVPEKQKPVEPK